MRLIQLLSCGLTYRSASNYLEQCPPGSGSTLPQSRIPRNETVIHSHPRHSCPRGCFRCTVTPIKEGCHLYTGRGGPYLGLGDPKGGSTLSRAHLATCPGLLLTTGQRVDQLRGATWVGDGVTRATKMIPHGNHIGRALALTPFKSHSAADP